MDTPQISFCIINWNGKEMLRGLLESIRANEGDLSVQTIVVDNLSGDGSPDMVEKEFPWVKLKRNTVNVGAAAGYNQCVELADAPLVILSNNDVLVRPGGMQKLLEFMEKHPEVVAAGPKLIGGDGIPQKTGRNLPSLWALMNYVQFVRWTLIFRPAYRRYRQSFFDPEKPGMFEQISASVLMVRKDAYLRNPFDIEYRFGIEDVDFCKRLGSEGKIYYLPEAEFVHLGRISSRANRGFAYIGFECGWVRYLRKFHGKYKANLYRLLVTIDIPFRLLSLSGQWMIHRMRGKPEKAKRIEGLMKATREFADALGVYWKA